ncbi:MAG: hypothetical protein JNL83_17005 [Myxococcales bacterium]|nr:hypothetical protein [Myxococcales bacterium]
MDDVAVRRHARARLRLRQGDIWIGLSALTAAMLALPFAQNSWNGPEVASVLAVSATAMLAGQRWAIALVVVAELLLLPTVAPRAFVMPQLAIAPLASLVALAMLVPGLLATRRAAAALVLVTGWRRTQRTCRRLHTALIFGITLVALLPFL